MSNRNKKQTNAVKPATPQKKGRRGALRTTQQTLPWICCYENGVMQAAPGVFTKSFAFRDMSFRTKSDEEQDTVYEAYMRFLNWMTAGEDLYITFVNHKEDEQDKLSSILPVTRGDKFDIYRKEIADVLRTNMSRARNSITTTRYITVSIRAEDVDKAMHRLDTLESDLILEFRKITQDEEAIRSLTLAERLEVLSSILNGEDTGFWFEHKQDGTTILDLNRMAKQGYTTKDVVAPDSFRFYGNRFDIGERVGQAMYLDGIANWMDTNFLPALISVNFESVFTMHISVMEQGEATKKIHNQSVNIGAEIETKADNRAAKGKDPTMIPADLRRAQAQIEDLQDDLLNRDQRLFFMSLNLCHFAENEEELKVNTKTIRDIGSKYMCTIKPLFEQQERGLASALPVGLDKCFSSRLMTTETLGVFLPFDEVNQFDKGGIYYGVNALNKTLIVYDRTKAQNYNGLVLGYPGSGKSFSAKREIASVFLNKSDSIYVIDPDGEYSPLATAFDGEVIKIAPGNGVYINPFDLDIDNTYDRDLNPLAMKTDFICGLVETMLGGKGTRLTPTQRAVMDRCIQQIYRPYLEHLAELPPDRNGMKKTIDRDYCPTMQSLFDALLSQPQPEAQNLALIMEPYTTGTFDTFAHRTNVDIDNRLIIYDISNIGTNLLELGLKICTNEVWTRMLENRRVGRWTRFYIDEFHLLMANESTAEFSKTIWKRARKFWGIPTGITQNVEELLESPAARAIINNTSFVYMLNQSMMDRGMLKELLHLSDSDLTYVTNVQAGHGLIFTGSQAIPFEDAFPEDTELYKIMSTKAGESA